MFSCVADSAGDESSEFPGLRSSRLESHPVKPSPPMMKWHKRSIRRSVFTDRPDEFGSVGRGRSSEAHRKPRASEHLLIGSSLVGDIEQRELQEPPRIA